jgi:hypothetical protein
MWGPIPSGLGAQLGLLDGHSAELLQNWGESCVIEQGDAEHALWTDKLPPMLIIPQQTPPLQSPPMQLRLSMKPPPRGLVPDELPDDDVPEEEVPLDEDVPESSSSCCDELPLLPQPATKVAPKAPKASVTTKILEFIGDGPPATNELPANGAD